MYKIFLTFFILLFSFVGCAAASDNDDYDYSSESAGKIPWIITACIDERFENKYYKQILVSIEEWDKALGVTFKIQTEILSYTMIDVAPSRCRVVILRNSSFDDIFYGRKNIAGLAFVGGTHSFICVDRINPYDYVNSKGITYNDMRFVVSHEIGHLFYLIHGDGGIMERGNTPDDRVTEQNALYAIEMLMIEVEQGIIPGS
jgi:hypothetical protein